MRQTLRLSVIKPGVVSALKNAESERPKASPKNGICVFCIKSAIDMTLTKPISAFWLRSSVVSVLISLTSDTFPSETIFVKLISGKAQDV
jgi:hypothetical protein